MNFNRHKFELFLVILFLSYTSSFILSKPIQPCSQRLTTHRNAQATRLTVRHRRFSFALLESTKDELQSDNNTEVTNVDQAKDIETGTATNLRNSYAMLLLLFVTFTSNQWARQALYYLCDFSDGASAERHVNIALNFNKEMYATLASLCFTVVFAIGSLFAGGISDTNNRSIVIAVSCATWSAATALQSLATSYYELIPLRALIGMSQSFFNPAAYTLISDIFPAKMVGSVNGIFSGGVYLGGGLASLSILLDNIVGWRKTLFIIGGLGLLVAVLCLVAINDPRNKELSTTPVSLSPSTSISDDNIGAVTTNLSAYKKTISALSDVLSTSDAKLLYTATALRFCAGFSIGIWKAPFVFSKFPGSEAAFAGSNAAVVAGGGILSSLIGGYISDALANPKNKDQRPVARSWVPAIGSLLAAPLWAAFILTDDPSTAAACLLGEYLVAECWFGPTLASLFDVVPKDRRGVAQGLFSVLTAAGNLAPILVGALAGGSLGSFGLPNVLLWTVSGAYAVSGALFIAAALAEDKRIKIKFENELANKQKLH